MNKKTAESALAKALTGITPFSRNLFITLKELRKITDNQLLIEFFILDYHSALEGTLIEVLTANISQNNPASRNEIEKYFRKQTFSHKMKWIKNCHILDTSN